MCFCMELCLAPLVATDRWDHIPEPYRARVTVRAAADDGTGRHRREDLSLDSRPNVD
jgi:hypothetical protein